MTNLKNIVLLAGGDGDRFNPLAEKNLTVFLGKPLICHQVEKLLSFTDHLYVVTGKNNTALFQRVLKLFSPLIFLTQSSTLRGEADALLTAKNIVKGPALVLNANDVFDYSAIDKLHRSDELSFLAKRMTDYFPGGYVKLKEGKPIEIVEKPAPDKIPSPFVKLVCDYFADLQAFLKIIVEIKTGDDAYEKGLNILLSRTKKTSCVAYADYWYSLKYPWHVLPLMNFYLAKITENTVGTGSVIAKTALLIPPVHIGANVRIGEFAKIVGPVFIGDNTTVADYALIRLSMIGDNCVVGGYSEVARSYLADQVLLHRNYVGDSILAKGVLMGSGATTANYRFDGQPIFSTVSGNKISTSLSKLGAIVGEHAKIGVNATLLPGVKIGQKTYVGPGEVVSEDLVDGLFIFKNKRTVNQR
ncbi:hypothetical protein HY214_00655 [Candidatus Roizmanbacteria bacterium]|nr:hypothetical protein [Candidatus Roizmanbacteria bacterium]